VRCPSTPDPERCHVDVWRLRTVWVSDYGVDNAINRNLYNTLDRSRTAINPEELIVGFIGWPTSTMGCQRVDFETRGGPISGARHTDRHLYRSGGGWTDRNNGYITHGYDVTGRGSPGPAYQLYQ
jgi:hypothetical protein